MKILLCKYELLPMALLTIWPFDEYLLLLFLTPSLPQPVYAEGSS